MTVNITQNALGSKLESDSSRSTGTKQTPNKTPEQKALNKLSSGVSLPEKSLSNQNSESYIQDTSEVSEKAVSRSISNDTNFSEITAMQDEVAKLDSLQTSLESVSKDIWGIDEQVTAAQKISQDSKQDVSTDLSAEASNAAKSVAMPEIDTAPYEAMREEMQQVVNMHLEGIDETGKQLLNYLSDFRDKFLSEIDINTEKLGNSKEGSKSSLSSLKGDVALSSEEASEILSKAKEEVASLQVSTEMHRSNVLNDIGKAINSATNELEKPDTNQSIKNSVQEVSKILQSNPSAITSASQIDTTQVASLLL